MLEGRVAIVTGGGRGIGRAYAERLAAYGARVVVNDAGSATDGAETDEDPAAEVVAAIRASGGEAVALRGDVSSMAIGRELCELALETWGRLDVVINNAGIGRPRMVFNLAEDEWDDVIRVHLKGTFAVSQPACRWWRAQAKEHGSAYGRIVNTATGLLLYGGAGQSNYVAAKAGIVAFTEAIATEMAPYGVTANAIMPSAATRLASIGWRMAGNAGAAAARVTSTGRTGEAHAEATGNTGAAAARVTSTGQTGEAHADATVRIDPTDPVHVAEFGCYLASPAAGWISGQTFQVRGATIEHAGSWRVDRTVSRTDHGWTAPELAGEMPRAFGAGAKRSDPPPDEWREQYAERKRTSPASE
jgi:NAD(P)-dependent dehydrogenase (short-subunit alcohol dehydrogenase family)